MSRAASQSQRAQQARSGRSGRGGAGMTGLPNGRGGFVSVTNGSVINYGGVDKFGLYPTVGVSIGFLNMLENCCRGDSDRFGVNTNNYGTAANINKFLM
tara:strand:- start:383 stop:679 length:297 start_codon:yes stop_codon:yes gene_type:complete